MTADPIETSDPCYLQGIEDEIECIHLPPAHYDSAQQSRWRHGQMYSSFHNLAHRYNPRLIDQPLE